MSEHAAKARQMVNQHGPADTIHAANTHAILAVADQIEQLVKLQRAYLEHFGIDLDAEPR